MRARLGDPFEGMSPDEQKAAERRDDRDLAKWKRRIDVAVAAWHALPALEQKAWVDAYLRDARKRSPETKPPAATDLPLLYAIDQVAEREAAKAAKQPRIDHYAAHRAATEPRAPRTTRPAAATGAPAAGTEPPKPPEPPPWRKRRRGPAYGPIGESVPGQRFHYYDDDDEE